MRAQPPCELQSDFVSTSLAFDFDSRFESLLDHAQQQVDVGVRAGRALRLCDVLVVPAAIMTIVPFCQSST